MIAAPGLRWILTLVLVALTVHAGRRLARSLSWRERVSNLAHLVMAAAMAVMCWPRGMDLPAAPQVALFAAAALWYPVSAALGTGEGSLSRRFVRSLPHAAAMAAMGWMLYAMGQAMEGGGHAAGDGSGHGGHAHHGGGGGDLATMSLGDPGQQALAGVLGLLMLACGLWWLARGFDRARAYGPGAPAPAEGADPDHRAGELFCHGVMAVVMAVMCALMT